MPKVTQEKLEEWVRRFEQTGGGCPACGCRHSLTMMSGTAVELKDEARSIICVVCLNPDCGFVRQFAPKI